MSLKPHKPMATAVQALGQRWQTLSPREQGLLSWGATLLAVALVWWLALAPALRTVREARSVHPLKSGVLSRSTRQLRPSTRTKKLAPWSTVRWCAIYC